VVLSRTMLSAGSLSLSLDLTHYVLFRLIRCYSAFVVGYKGGRSYFVSNRHTEFTMVEFSLRRPIVFSLPCYPSW
jgi:hypothetical protein